MNSVAYENYDYFVSLLLSFGQGCFIAKADIESAFRIIPIHPSDYHHLGFTMINVFLWAVLYHAKCLNNVTYSWRFCIPFTMWIGLSKLSIPFFLDGWISVHSSKFYQNCRAVHMCYCSRYWSHKLQAAITRVRSFRRRRKVTLRELQSLIGTLNFACKVVVPGTPLNRLHYGYC